MLPPVYPILDVSTVRAEKLNELELLESWIRSGLNFVQIRWKESGLAEYVSYGQKLKSHFPALRIVANDHYRAVMERPDVFELVHLGQEDYSRIPELPDRVRFGISTHNARQMEVAIAMFKRGLPGSYIALGPVRPTKSKPTGTDPVLSESELAECLQLFRSSSLDLVLIGGIDSENISSIVYPGFARDYGFVPTVAAIRGALGSGLTPIAERIRQERSGLKDR